MNGKASVSKELNAKHKKVAPMAVEEILPVLDGGVSLKVHELNVEMISTSGESLGVHELNVELISTLGGPSGGDAREVEMMGLSSLDASELDHGTECRLIILFGGGTIRAYGWDSKGNRKILSWDTPQGS